jgi:uncharacterized membrane protein HdeD (DUF308 family)
MPHESTNVTDHETSRLDRPDTRQVATSSGQRWLVSAAVAAGIALIVIGVIYFVEPARSLPQLFPGRQAGSSHHHVKHGIAALLLGIACLVFAWFRSAPDKPNNA